MSRAYENDDILLRGIPGPCEVDGKRCDLWKSCATNLTSCAAFSAFVNSPYSRERWAAGRRGEPTRERYERIFSGRDDEPREPRQPGPSRGFKRGPRVPHEVKIAKLRALGPISSISRALRSVGIAHGTFKSLCEHDPTLRAFLQRLTERRAS